MEENANLSWKDAKLNPNDNDYGVILQQNKLLALLRGIASKHTDDFYCLSCFHFLAKKSMWKYKIFVM